MKLEINCFTSAMFHNLGLMVLIGVAIYLTKEPWILLALIFCKTCETKNDGKEE